MTATTVPTDITTRANDADIGLRPRRVLAAEWRKVVSLRSTWWFVATIVLGTVGVGSFMAIGVLLDEVDGAASGPLGGALTGMGLAELIVAALAVLTVTGEYASGAIRTTFTAVPRRSAVVAAKAAVVSGAVLVLSLVLTFGTFALVSILMATAEVDLRWSAPGVLRALIGGAVYLALMAALGVGLGWMLRSTAGAISAVFGIIYVLPLIGLMLPPAVAADITKYLPSNAVAVVVQPAPVPGLLPPWAGLAVMAGWSAAALIGAAIVVHRRDA
jgi:ABC-2 type transport system permease protein